MATGAQPLPFMAAALAEARVGTWTRDGETGLVRGDATYALIFDVPAHDLAHGIPHELLARRIHPDDRGLYHGRMTRIRRHGGLVIVQYRLLLASGEDRLVMVRGQYDPVRPDGRSGSARGITIDLTEERHDLGGQLTFVAPAEAADADGLEPLHRATDHALALRREVRAMPAAEAATLRPLSELLLIELACRLASRLAEAGHEADNDR